MKHGDTTIFTDTSKVQDSPAELKKFLKNAYGIELTDLQTSRLAIPARSVKAKALYEWLDKFITVASCINPTNGKLQLEMCGIEELYLIYVSDCINMMKEPYVPIKYFSKFFNKTFSFVQIRKKKSVTGKCNICSILSYLRSKCTSTTEIAAISKLFATHKIAFMGERATYYERRSLGQNYPKDHLSLITDGMAQQHCILPWMKGKNQPVDIKQHLQGTLVHGKNIIIYRTFNNVKVV